MKGTIKISVFILLLWLSGIFIQDAKCEVLNQQLTVSGKVTDASTGETLPGVNIQVKGTASGTATDARGQYELTVESQQDTLVFSFVGYQTREVPVNGRSEINIIMKPQLISGKEMVVIGYGSQQEEDITGSISSISTDELENQPVSSFDALLQGRAAGVQVTQTSNAPGQGVSIRIRGNNSLLSSSEPLYVIDGVPTSSPNGAPTINPDNIKSIQILKDASSTAIYGSRGANGVVLVTTKGGTANQNMVNISAEYGVQKISKKLNLLNAREFATLSNEAIKNGNQYLPADQQKDLLYDNPDQFGKGTDWENEMYSMANKQNYNATFSGGTEQTQYSISGNYLNQVGIRRGDDLQRDGMQVNANSQISKKFKIGEHLTLSRIVQNPESKTSVREGRGSEISLSTIIIPPTLPVKYDDGTYSVTTDVQGAPKYGNPVQLAADISSKRYTNYVLGDVYGEYDFLKNLTLKASIGLNAHDKTYKFYLPKDVLTHGGPLNGEASIQNISDYTWVNENTLTYKGVINDHNSLNILGGFSIQATHSEFNINSIRGFANDFFKYNNLGAGSSLQLPSSETINSKLISYFGRAQYNRSDKYLLTGTLRVDGSSKFGSNNKYGTFPSGSVGWIISNEDFMSNLSTLNFLKLRASYGITGNQAIGAYGSYGLIGSDSYPIGGTRVIGLGPGSLGNPNLEWEKTSEFDIGLDSGFFNDRLSLTADYYNKKTTNLLLELNIPATSGFEDALQNIGSIRNRGWEFSVQSKNIVGVFNWNTDINLSTNKNEVLDIGPNEQLFFSSDLHLGNVTRIIKPGQDMGELYGYVFDGLWENQQAIDAAGTQPSAHPGDSRFKDLNNDGVINAEDRSVIGNTSPDFIFGITNTFQYKMLSLRIFLQGVYGNDIVFASRPWLLGVSGLHNNSKAALDRWTPDNKNTDIPRATFQRSFSKLANSSWMLEDGTYLRVKNMRLNYRFPSRMNQKMHLNNASVFLNVQNAYTFTNYSGYDPDVNTNGQDNILQGEDNASYALPRIYSLGIKLQL